MESNEKQLVDALFAKIQQAATQSGMRDAQVETLITEHMQRIPRAAYYMAQTIIIQREAVRQAEARIAELEQQLANRQSAQASVPPQPQQPQQSGGGFLEGVAQTALGIAGGVFLTRGIDNLVDSITGADRFFEDVVASDLLGDTVEDAYISGYEDAADDIEDLADDLLGDDDDWGF